MNWYIVVGIVSAVLLGWAVGIWIGAKKGYAAAKQEQKEQEAQKSWSDFMDKFKGGKK
jgi:Na+/glutamate symporter